MGRDEKVELEKDSLDQNKKQEMTHEEKAELAKSALEKMYELTMTALNAMTVGAEGVAGTAISVYLGGIDMVFDLAKHPGENHYKGIGRAVGNMLNIPLSITGGMLLKNREMSIRMLGGAGTYQVLTKINLGDMSADFFNTFVANADRFYEEILTNKAFFKQTLNGLKERGIMNFCDYFDPDGDGNVSASDIVNGYKKLFSKPAGFGTMEFEEKFKVRKEFEVDISLKDKTLTLTTPTSTATAGAVGATGTLSGTAASSLLSSASAALSAINAALNSGGAIEHLALNDRTYDVKQLSNLQIRNIIDKIPEVSFLLSNILIRPGEKLDLGEGRIYTVKRGDTLSQIAARYGLKTKDVVMKNMYLVDEGRIKFQQDSILIQTNTYELNSQAFDTALNGLAYAQSVLAAGMQAGASLINDVLMSYLNNSNAYLNSQFNFLIYDPLALDLNGDGK
ncbi:LysM domain-containing protein, partial [uncultured Campylobacter sp.]|uniref:LysM peptidoglycan-binding domain-containing protein n=1 Tax=uncultured Campylobacter sp. TaxID=218934 RepID=UPI00260733C5